MLSSAPPKVSKPLLWGFYGGLAVFAALIGVAFLKPAPDLPTATQKFETERLRQRDLAARDYERALRARESEARRAALTETAAEAIRGARAIWNDGWQAVGETWRDVEKATRPRN